jgi:hypothetical protein
MKGVMVMVQGIMSERVKGLMSRLRWKCRRVGEGSVHAPRYPE